MFTGRDILWVIVVPGVIGLVFTLITSFIKYRAWGASLALVCGLLVTFSYTNDWAIPRIPPDPDLGFAGWITVAAVIALAAGLLDSFVKLPLIVRVILVLIASAVSLPLLLKFKFSPDDWTRGEGAKWIAGLCVIAAIWWYCLEDVAKQAPTTFGLISWLITAAAAACISMLATQQLGNLFLSIAAVSAAMALVWIFRGVPGAARGAAMTVSVILINLFAGVHYTSDVGLLPMGLLAAGPVFAWIGRWTPARWRPWQRGTIRFIVTLLIIAAAVIVSVVQFRHKDLDEETFYNSPRGGISVRAESVVRESSSDGASPSRTQHLRVASRTISSLT